MTAFGRASPGLGCLLAPSGLKVVDVEAQDVGVFNGVGDGVFVELLLEQVFRGADWPASPSICSATVAFSFKDGRAGKAEELALGRTL